MIELTALQASRVLGVDPDSVRRWARKGLQSTTRMMPVREGRKRRNLKVIGCWALNQWCRQTGACPDTRGRLWFMARQCAVVATPRGKYQWHAGAETGVSGTLELAADDIISRVVAS